MDYTKLDFAERLNLVMTANGFKYRGRATLLSELMNVSVKAASKWLSGESIPDTSKIPRIADAVGTYSEWLISGKGIMLRSSANTRLQGIIDALIEMEESQQVPDHLLTVFEASISGINPDLLNRIKHVSRDSEGETEDKE